MAKTLMSGLSDRERKFVKAYAASGNQGYAAAQAGYANTQVSGCALIKRPQVVAAIKAAQEQRLVTEGLDAAVGLLVKYVTDETVKPEVRLAAAKTILANTIGKTQQTQEKSPEDMTPDELDQRIASLRARQAALADGAKIIDAQAVEVSNAAAQHIDLFD